ncbi:MAG: hypothetical protein SGPRY_013254 [Prymnesium sp.]
MEEKLREDKARAASQLQKLRCTLQEVRKENKISRRYQEREQADVRAEVLRLQARPQVARAHQEATTEAERAAKSKELRAADQVTAEKEVEQLKAEKEAKRQQEGFRAEEFRLQGHVARAHQEAATEAARSAKFKEMRASEQERLE